MNFWIVYYYSLVTSKGPYSTYLQIAGIFPRLIWIFDWPDSYWMCSVILSGHSFYTPSTIRERPLWIGALHQKIEFEFLNHYKNLTVFQSSIDEEILEM